MLAEPDFASERQLEDAIAEVAHQELKQVGLDTLVLRGFGLDLSVFWTKNGEAACRFFEVKAPAEHHGRCGFGGPKGEGNQIKLLFDAACCEPRKAEQLRIFSPFVRWIVGNRSRPLGSARFAFFTCEQAQSAAANGVRPGKQNNFRLSAFETWWMTWPELVQRTTEFLRATRTPPKANG